MNTLKYIKGSKNDTKHDQYEFECWHSKQKKYIQYKLCYTIK